MTEMFREGLGNDSEFSSYHPFTCLIYYIIVITMAMFSSSPVFTGAAFLCSWLYSVLLDGRRALKKNLLFMVPIVILMTVINVFFSHNGDTVLTYISGNRITLEALWYGISSAVVITVVIVWFTSFNIIMGADKITYLFGRTAPVLGLTISMILRFIPLLKERYHEIHTGQLCMGRGSEKSLMKKVGQVMKEVSILISWSLESSIETADSMEARGYGLKGRSSYHIFRITPKDRAAIIYMTITGGIALTGCFLGRTVMEYYPRTVVPEMDPLTVIILAAYLLVMMMPIYIDLKGERKWKQLELKI